MSLIFIQKKSIKRIWAAIACAQTIVQTEILFRNTAYSDDHVDYLAYLLLMQISVSLLNYIQTNAIHCDIPTNSTYMYIMNYLALVTNANENALISVLFTNK